MQEALYLITMGFPVPTNDPSQLAKIMEDKYNKEQKEIANKRYAEWKVKQEVDNKGHK